MYIFQKARAGRNSTVFQAGGSVKVRGTGNRTAGAGSYNNVFADNSTMSITQANGVSVKQHDGRVDIDLPKGYNLYINGEYTDY